MIRTGCVPTASFVSRPAKSRGVIIPGLPNLRIVLGMTRVRRYLPPSMTRQEPVVDRGCHLPPQALGQRGPNRRQNQHFTGQRLFCPRPQKLPFFLFAHQCAAPSAPTLAAEADLARLAEPGLEPGDGCSSYP